MSWIGELLKIGLNRFEISEVERELYRCVGILRSEKEGLNEFGDYIDFTLFDKKYCFDYDFSVENYEIVENITLISVEIFDIRKLLKDNNIKDYYISSSGSVYLENGSVRISDHERPQYEVSGVWYNHNYKKEFIVENDIKIFEKVANYLGLENKTSYHNFENGRK